MRPIGCLELREVLEPGDLGREHNPAHALKRTFRGRLSTGGSLFGLITTISADGEFLRQGFGSIGDLAVLQYLDPFAPND
jgi:hypothetical protein